MKYINIFKPRDDLEVDEYFRAYDNSKRYDRYQHLTTYEEPYSRANLTVFRFMLARNTFNPTSSALITWRIYRGIFAILSIFIRFIPGSSHANNHFIYPLVCFLDFTAVVDMYLQLHVQYWRADGILITHTLYTAKNFLQNNFLVNLIGVLPTHHFFPNRALFQLNVLFQMPQYIFALEHVLKVRRLSPLNATLCRILPLVMIVFNTLAAILLSFICKFGSRSDISPNYGNWVSCEEDSWMTKLAYHKPLSPIVVWLNGKHTIKINSRFRELFLNVNWPLLKFGFRQVSTNNIT